MSIIITQSMIASLSEDARKNTRMRLNKNFHTSYEDTTNRMLNAFEPETYVRPHKHEDPDKWEVFILLIGRLAVITFKENGDVEDITILDHEKGVYGIELPARTWHTVVSLRRGTVVYEIKPGPYTPINDKNFAPWAPEEYTNEMQSYMHGLQSHIEHAQRK